jgi:deazaflavin-dependent oxidoreductase (nitroreductase family)
MNAAAIIIIAIAATGVLMMRFRRRWLAKINIAFTNRITGVFAGWLPGFGILTHVGRKSGKVYRTPVNVFRASNGFIIALTYSSQSEWVKNVLAAGGCELKTRGKKYRLSALHVVGILFAACDAEERLWYEFFMMTGEREQEVMYTYWTDINFKTSIVRVSRKPERIWTPKAYKEREIPIPATLATSLKAWQAKAEKTCDLVFPTSGCKVKMNFLDDLKAVAQRAEQNPEEFGSTSSGRRSRLGASGRALIFVPCSSGLDTRTCRARCAT